MGVENAITSMGVLLIVTALGFFASKLGYIDDRVSAGLTKLILNIALPCMIVGSVSSMDSSMGGGQIAWTFALAAALFFVLLAVGLLCVIVLRVPADQRRLYAFMSVFTNMGFIGMPLIASIYGNSSILLSGIFLLVLNALVYSMGIAVLVGKDAGQPRAFAIDWKAMINGPMISSVVAICLFFAGVRFPAVVDQTLQTVGGITAPLAMMLVGFSISKASLREVVGEWRIYPFSLIKQLILPVALFFSLRGIIVDEMVMNVFVIMAAMPVAAVCPMIARAYGKNHQLAATGIVLSTLMSFVFVPLLVWMMAVA